MKLTWTETASEDALSIHAYIAKQSELYADAVYEKLLVRAQQLLNHPQLGSILPELERDDVREVFVHSFRLVYQVLPDEIRVLTVIHGARLLTLDPPDQP